MSTSRKQTNYLGFQKKTKTKQSKTTNKQKPNYKQNQTKNKSNKKLPPQ